MKHSSKNLMEVEKSQQIDDSFYLNMEVIKVRSILEKAIFIKQVDQCPILWQ
ncbi:hypothetical protein Cylst_1006 [Cylindrospermum stagnale PCC 7417]|uniref:Uncharacterized protein n=1 Tax=Cylindrospermum stagnale PCC 7417 TaxID=56107 RepID=K9WU65_9NOST|nr:hypothetical protein Cylst_1006 [Cylindrospermum stagnale PCC 7417]